jgi:hypothetical protein
MRRISKRLEALERAADREIFEDLFFPVAIAYHLGGAKDESDVLHAYARALGYQDLDELTRAFADLLCQPSDSVAERSDLRARADRAQLKLLAKFGYDPRRAPSAALADAPDRIMRSLPEEWRAIFRSAHRRSCEAEARASQLFKDLVDLAVAEECDRARQAKPRQGGPRR